MPKEFHRSRRVSEQLQRELSRIVLTEFQDPRMRLVTITQVEVSRDLEHAKVFVSVLGSDDASDAVKALAHASGKLRQILGRLMRMRVVPELHFAEDRALIEGSRLSALINQAVAEDGKHHKNPDDKQD